MKGIARDLVLRIGLAHTVGRGHRVAHGDRIVAGHHRAQLAARPPQESPDEPPTMLTAPSV